MAVKLFDRIRETTTTGGTGAQTLAGARPQFKAVSSVLSNGDTAYFCFADTQSTDWEVALCTYGSGGNTLTRSTPQASSNAGSAVAFTAGHVLDVAMVAPANLLLNLMTLTSAPYTAAGAISVSDRVALINSASNIAMTLASGTVDGWPLSINNLGAGVATITLSLQGRSQIFPLGTDSVLNIFWNAANSTWLLAA